MVSLKNPYILSGFEPGSSAPQVVAMTTAPRHQGISLDYVLVHAADIDMVSGDADRERVPVLRDDVRGRLEVEEGEAEHEHEGEIHVVQAGRLRSVRAVLARVSVRIKVSESQSNC
jgi:hypothetical protein